MVSLRRTVCLLGYTNSLAFALASLLPRQSSTGTGLRDIMDPQITSFVSSLAVPTPQAKAVSETLKTDSNLASFLQGKDWIASALTATACQSLQLILGSSKVDTMPVDQAKAHENWFVWASLIIHLS